MRAFAAHVAGAGWPDDDRHAMHPELGLFCVADARGPTYGGHHVPVGVDPGLAALADTFRATRDLAAAFHAAHASMLACSTQAAEHFTHRTASITAVAIADGVATIGQVGCCRAYHWRDGALTLLVPDHTLATATGREDPFAFLVVNAVLGYDASLDLRTATVALAPGDRILLCTDGAWSRAGVALALARAADEAALDAALRGTTSDATAIVIVPE